MEQLLLILLMITPNVRTKDFVIAKRESVNVYQAMMELLVNVHLVRVKVFKRRLQKDQLLSMQFSLINEHLLEALVLSSVALHPRTFRLMSALDMERVQLSKDLLQLMATTLMSSGIKNHQWDVCATLGKMKSNHNFTYHIHN